MAPQMLLAVPNVSEGRDERTILAVGQAFAAAGSSGGLPEEDVQLLDVHSDADHHRSVFTIAGPPVRLADAVLAGAREAIERLDVIARLRLDPSETGQHPYVGALDVAPVVYLNEPARGAACAEALVIADRIGAELRVPVFLYGELTGAEPGTARTRAEMRRGGAAGLAQRMAGVAGGGEALRPDFGPPRMHPSAGATLVAARPPLVALNLQLASPATLADARRIASLLREGGEEGLPGVRAIAVALSGGVAQVSMNVERPHEVPLAMVVERAGSHAAIAGAELVGLAPRAALEGFPEEVQIRGFDPARHVIENALGC
jgi:glutamate formiminotransferase